MEPQPFGDVAASIISNTAFDLDAVHVHFFEGFVDESAAGICNNTFTFIFFGYPVTDFQASICAIDVLESNKTGDSILKANCENHFPAIGVMQLIDESVGVVW